MKGVGYRERGKFCWERQLGGTEIYRVWGFGKIFSWICIMRLLSGVNLVTKQAWLEVWKQVRRQSRKGWFVQFMVFRIRFSQYRLQGGSWRLEGRYIFIGCVVQLAQQFWFIGFLVKVLGRQRDGVCVLGVYEGY